MLATNDKVLLYKLKQFLSKKFEMKDMSETSYVIDIKIYKERSKGILGCLKIPISKKI